MRTISIISGLIIFNFLFCSVAAGQLNADTLILNNDSIEQELDALLELYAQKKSKSHINFSLALNNTQLSLNNLTLNAQQNDPGTSISPTIEYFHKSGLSISYSNFLLLKEKKYGIIQQAISPGYTFSRDKKIDFGIYYTHFIKYDDFLKYASPYDHDAFFFIRWNTKYVQPALSFGYSIGQYGENTTSIGELKLKRPLRGDTVINFQIYDTIKVKLNDFSSSISLRKKFVFESRTPGNYIIFTPSLTCLFIQNTYDVTYKSASAFSSRTELILKKRPLLADNLRRQIRTQFPDLNQTRGFLNSTEFAMQSIGVNLDLTANFNKYYINPRIYLDYYLMSSENKFNLFFSLQTGIYLP
jgi:hypothetical protein